MRVSLNEAVRALKKGDLLSFSVKKLNLLDHNAWIFCLVRLLGDHCFHLNSLNWFSTFLIGQLKQSFLNFLTDFSHIFLRLDYENRFEALLFSFTLLLFKLREVKEIIHIHDTNLELHVLAHFRSEIQWSSFWNNMLRLFYLFKNIDLDFIKLFLLNLAVFFDVRPFQFDALLELVVDLDSLLLSP